MQRLLLLIGGPFLCVLLTIGLLLTGKSTISGYTDAAVPDMTLETPDLSDVPTLGEDAAAPDETEFAAPAVGAETDRTNEATALVPPAVTAALPAPDAEGPLEETIVRHPVALSAGLVQFENRTIQLAGVQPQSADRLCTTKTGDWPCGTVARTAFRNFIRARAFTCLTPQAGWTGSITTRCAIGADDPALWLARNGWAEAAAGNDTLNEAIATAKRTGKGFYRIAEPMPAAPPMTDATDLTPQ